MIYLAPDTNIFLHFKTLAQLSWTAIATGPLTIVVAPTVLEELDKKKWDSDRSLQSRARTALKLVEAAESATGGYAGPPVVVADRLPASWYEARNLQRESADHRIIGELLSFRETVRDADDLIVITADATMRRQAKSFGLPVAQLPESDELPVESDARDAAIRKLSDQVQRYESALPKIKPFISNGDYAGKTIRYSDPLDEKPSDEELDELIARLEQHHAQPKPGDQIPTADWTKYESQWQAFVEKYRVYCVNQWRYENRAFAFSLGITNTGQVTARDIELIVHFPDGFTVMREKKYLVPEMPGWPQRPLSPAESLAALFERFEEPGLLGGGLRFDVPQYLPKAADISGIRIRKTNSTEVELPLMTLKQTRTHFWEPLLLRYDDSCVPVSFVADYRLLIANSRGAETGQFKIKFGAGKRT